MSRIIENPYDRLPLNDTNLINYILSDEINVDNITLINTKELKVTPFLQSDFLELKEDCTFTSIVTCIHYLYPEVASPQEIYDTAIGIYRREYPSFQKIEGTIPFAIGHVYNEVFKYFKLPFYSIRSKYINKVGFSYNTIKLQIDQNVPVILSMWHDGRKCYKNHSLTVIGYIEFEMENVDPILKHIYPIKEKKLLMVYDNWSAEIRYVDLTQVSMISSIVF